MFVEREIYLRSHGHVRFIRISARAQKIAVGLVGGALLLWAIVTLAMLWMQASVTVHRTLLAAEQAKVSKEASTVNAVKRNFDDVAADVEKRQEMLEGILGQLGGQGLGKTVVGNAKGADAYKYDPGDDSPQNKAGDAISAIQKLQSLERRQIAFARTAAGLFNDRAQRAAAAIRAFGIDPQQMLQRTTAEGGPFIPWSRNEGTVEPSFSALATSIARMNALERGLAMLPSGRPTMTPMLTSSYGYRRDPFTGAAAFHAGLDFPGAYGQPILAAAPGRISFVGYKSGYGQCVEIDHGNNIITRYAHLAGFNVGAGQMVQRGGQIARMGSTGRSTGVHLHFEVRVNDVPINPRRFLEANQNVLEIQKIANERVHNVRG